MAFGWIGLTIAFADVALRHGHTITSTADGSGYLGAFPATVTDDGAGDGAGSVNWSFSVDDAVIQYLAVGVPGIAAPVGVNSEILDEGRNGFAAQSTEEWVSGLRALISSRDLLEQMGRRGRQTVTER